jgi:hypothetical protein
MLLFQSEAWGSLLHTGDCRLGQPHLGELKEALAEAVGDEEGRLDMLWLDATMGDNAAIVGAELGRGPTEGGAVCRWQWSGEYTGCWCRRLFGVCCCWLSCRSHLKPREEPGRNTCL